MLTLEAMTRQPLLSSAGPPFQSLYEASHCATLTLAMGLALNTNSVQSVHLFHLLNSHFARREYTKMVKDPVSAPKYLQ